MGVLLLRAVDSQAPLLAALEAVSLGDRDITTLTPEVLPLTTSVLTLGTATCSLRELPIRDPYSSFVASFSFALAFISAIRCDVSKASAIKAYGLIPLAVAFVNGVHVVGSLGVALTFPLLPLFL